MKKLVTIVGLFWFSCAQAQLYNAEWVIGPNTSILNFATDTIGLDTTTNDNMNTWETNADICDSNGGLLYFTNGFYIADKNGNSLENGDTLSPSTFTYDNYWQGDPLPQAAIFLPKPGNPRYYYLFHFAEDTLNRPNTIYYSLIDKEGNNGLGAVIDKNVPILKLTGNHILRGGGMTACKHANGRDYWIVIGGSNNNEFYKFLLTPDTIFGPFTQNIGPALPTPYDNSYSKFSQDGSKYVTSCYVGPVLVMDYDRCSGEFSNPTNIFHYAGTESNLAISGAISEEFSSNGKILYVNNVNDLTQYDLLTGTIQDSIELYVSDSSDFYGLSMLQLASNGKIYCSTWNGGLYALHVINYPDSIGISCNFVYGGQPTRSNNSVNVPNLINYNLGPLIGSGCDTVTAVSTIPSISSILRVLPNPANKFLYVEMGMQGNYEFDLLDINGQVLDKRQTPQVDYFDTEHLPAGNYLVRVLDKTSGKEVGSKKVVVVH